MCMVDTVKKIVELGKLVDKEGEISDPDKYDKLQEEIQQDLGLTDENCDALPEALNNLVERVKELERNLASHKHFADGSAGFKGD